MMKNILRCSIVFFLMIIVGRPLKAQQIIDLSRDWLYRIAYLDKRAAASWFDYPLHGHLHLPGSLTSNGIGNPVTLYPPWTGEIIDSSFFATGIRPLPSAR